MPNVLEVQIVGDVSNLEKSLKKAESLQAEYTASIEKTSKELSENIAVSNSYKKAIEDLNKEYKNGAISSKDYSKQLSNLKRDEKETTIVTADLRKELSNLKREQKEVGGSFDTVAKKTANGGNALMQFSRIAQDAPYGIIGIGNNITAAVESFGHLQRSTGSAGGALKALSASLLGGGGVLLAISLLTTGLTVMAQKGLSVDDVFEKLTGTSDDYANALKTVNEEAYNDDGVKEAIANVSELTINIGLAKEGFIDKQKVVDQYNETIGATTGLVDDLDAAEAGLIRNADAYIKMTLYKAAANIALEQAAQKTLDAERARAKKLTEFTNAFLDADLTQTRSKEQYEAKQQNLKRQQEIRQKEEVKINQDAANANISIAKKFQQDAAKIAKDFNFNIFGDTKKDKKKSDAPEIDLTPKITALPKLETTAEISERYLKAFQEQFGDQLNQKIEPIELNIPLQVVTESASFADYAAKLELAKEQTQIFADASGSAIGALAGELASNLETGNAAIDAFVGSVIQGLAQVAAAQLSGLIAKQAVAATSLTTDAAVATGNSVVAATETASASGPAAAFVLPALVGAAIGFIAAAFSGIKFAHGGIVPGGSFTGDKIPAMLNSGEAVMNQQQQANTLMAIANGNSNSLQGNRKNSTFNLETKLRGSDILLALKREENKR